MKNVSLLGATGSIGLQTLDVIRSHPEKFKLVAFSFGKNIDKAREIIREFQPNLVSCQLKKDCEKLKQEFPSSIKFTYGDEGLLEVAAHPDANLFMNAIMGSIGVLPTIEAIRERKTIAIANKETLVTAGHIVMAEAEKNNVPVIPVDSEHSAIFQCLEGENRKNIERLIITASGGSFRDKPREELVHVTVKEALKHPNWSMGAKITIDSATMMNKGLEVIEARWLFNQPYEKITVLLHRESTIHSMVEFQDGSVIAQLGTPDMRIPIQYALTYPERLQANVSKLDLAEIGTLHFEEIDFKRYPCLAFAYEAGKTGGTMPVVLNAANEVSVDAFLKGNISFLDIEYFIEQELTEHDPIPAPDLETILEVDRQTRIRTKEKIASRVM